MHLAVNAVQRFFAPGHFGRDARVGQRTLGRFQNAAHDLAPIAASRLHRLLERGVPERRANAEAQFLQLPVCRIQAEAVRDRRVNLHRLAGNAAPLLRRHVVERAHVVRTIGELDENHAHIARHREQHLAEALGLRLFAALEFKLVQLGQAVDQLCDFGAELLGKLALGHALVFDHVVQQRRHDRLHIQLPARADLCHGHGMRDVRLAALAVLPEVRLIGEVERFLHQLEIRRLQIRQLFGQPRNGDDLLARRCRRLRGRAEKMPIGLLEHRINEERVGALRLGCRASGVGACALMRFGRQGCPLPYQVGATRIRQVRRTRTRRRGAGAGSG